MIKVYLDYAATTPLNKDIYNSYNQLLLESFANADSNHFLGNQAKNYLKTSRVRIADLLNIEEKEVIFTSGSTEANNMAIKGVCFAYLARGQHIITTKIEHPSVLDCFKQLETLFNFEVDYLDVDKNGCVDLDNLKSHLRKDTILVSIMAVNNEIGSINDIKEIVRVVRENSTAFLHVDATQAIGKENIDFSQVDLYTFSAHKIYGLKGSGVLIKKENVRLIPLITGGEQEQGLRGGTSNWAAYTMMAKTLRIALNNLVSNHLKVSDLNTYTRKKLSSIKGIEFNSSNKATPYILNFYIDCV